MFQQMRSQLLSSYPANMN